MAQRKKGLIKEGKLDKHGKPNDKTPKDYLEGYKSVEGAAKPPELAAAKKLVEEVKKSDGDVWIFTARVKYMQFDATLPIPVPVKWAGDTPVVTLTDAVLPGLGDKFSCRVIFHEDRYAGTWQHGDFGGHMFGRIEKQEKKNTAGAKDERQRSVTE